MGDRLKGKVALITGAGNGIGRETAQLFASEGAQVVACDLREDDATQTVRMIEQAGGEAVAFVMDVAKAAEVEACIRFATGAFGKLNILVNNAGVGGALARLPDVSEEEWDRVMNVNLKGVFFCLKYGIPALVNAGGVSIVNIASAAGIVGTPQFGPYGPSKAGVIQLTKTAALEWARAGIRVNAVCPSFTATNMVKELEESTRNPERTRQRLTEQIPLGRLGQPGEIAHAILYLASDESSFVTGLALSVDGGLTAM